jgi:hypothetical protein
MNRNHTRQPLYSNTVTPRTVRRGNSAVSNMPKNVKINHSLDDFKEIEEKVQNELLNDKINKLNESIQCRNDEEQISQISKMLEAHMEKVNINIEVAINKQHKMYEEHEDNNKHKYDELLKSYVKLRNSREDHFFKCSKAITHYQSIMFNMSKVILNSNVDFSPCKEEVDALEKVLESVNDEERETEKLFFSNPVVNRRYSNPVIQTRGKNKKEAESHFRDEELKSLLTDDEK